SARPIRVAGRDVETTAVAHSAAEAAMDSAAVVAVREHCAAKPAAAPPGVAAEKRVGEHSAAAAAIRFVSALPAVPRRHWARVGAERAGLADATRAGCHSAGAAQRDPVLARAEHFSARWLAAPAPSAHSLAAVPAVAQERFRRDSRSEAAVHCAPRRAGLVAGPVSHDSARARPSVVALLAPALVRVLQALAIPLSPGSAAGSVRTVLARAWARDSRSPGASPRSPAVLRSLAVPHPGHWLSR